jgi:hypothetical protein
MEFYSATKKNEILSISGKWMELENIILSEKLVRFRRPKSACSSSYADYRPKTDTAKLCDMGHTKGRPWHGSDRAREKPKT